MKTNRKNILILPLLLSALLLSSCSGPQGRVDVVPLSGSAARPNNSTEPAEASPKSEQVRQGQIAKRFQEPAAQGQTVIESAMQLSEKYAKIYEEAVSLREKNQNLTDENHQLKEQINVLEADLKQTQRELTEANDLLIEMHIELNNWKTDILGFRDEIRGAETAQLEALLKILKILGGEVMVESAPGGDKDSTAVSSVESAQQKSENTSNRGEPNE
jgi:chromosome segregation ATPase